MTRRYRCCDGSALNLLGTVFLLVSVLLSVGACSSKRSSSVETSPATLKAQRTQQFQSETNIYQQLTKQLQREIKAGQAQVRQLDSSLKVIMASDTLFPGGGWNIDRRGREMLDKIIPTVKDLKNSDIEVNGFTDNSSVPSSMRAKVSTNRELSLARAVDVVNYLKQKGISPGAITATGYGADQPVSANDTPQGRAKNRRIEILILSAGN
jgi:chemotaxis protein MotB